MKDTRTNRIIALICRIVVGCVFVFSGFVKGVDPMGTAYKIEEYMTVWSVGGLSFEWAVPLAALLSVLLVTLEFTVGVLLITGAWRKFTAWTLLLMVVFFTITTFVDALTNKVSDCGCFGDAIKLTNWQTFWKNVVLLVLTVVIFLCRKHARRKHFERDTLITLVAVAAMVLFALHNIKNEPCIDFRPWKVGNRMIPEGNDLQVQSFVTYREKTTGQTVEMPSAELMTYYADSSWREAWEFVDSRVVNPYEIQASGFCMIGPDGEDYSLDIVNSPSYVLIATVHHLDKLDEQGTVALRRTHTFCVDHGVNMVLLTSAAPEEIQAYLHDAQLDEMIYYFADATAIKTMLRSNPGFILIKDAVVEGKWSVANYLAIQEFPFQEE